MTLPASADAAVAARYDLARSIAADAARTALGWFERREELVVKVKSAMQDLVSEADRRIEADIRAAIKARFPEDGALGEEEGLVPGTSGFTWVIDPIDGTQAFLTGQPNWCVSIAVRDGDGVCCGVVAAPRHGETFRAVRGGGAFLNDRPISVDPAASVKTGNIAYGGTNSADPVEAGRFVEALYRAGGVIFRVGSGAIMLCYVASARLAGYHDPHINDWDCAAGNLIVEEAGGVVDYRAPSILQSGPIFAGSAVSVAELVELVGMGR